MQVDQTPAGATLVGSAAAALLFVGRDIHDFRRDRADIRHDVAKLQEERAERDYALKRELRAFWLGAPIDPEQPFRLIPSSHSG